MSWPGAGPLSEFAGAVAIPSDLSPARPAAEPDRIAYLDGWRGLSILLVLAGHFLGGELWLAGFGVRLFFALSGRLMAEILFVQKVPLGHFYRRRFARIYPALAVFVLLTWMAVRGGEGAFDLSAVASALTFSLNYALASGLQAAPIENLWSLCIEEHAYILLGALAFLLRRRRLDPVVVLLAVGGLSILDGLVSMVVLHQHGGGPLWRSDAQLAPIFLAAAAYLALRGRPIPGWVPLVAFLAAVLAARGPLTVANSLTPVLLAVAVATLDSAAGEVRRALAWRPLTHMGVWSYSIYLWQHPFYRLAIAERLPPWAALALGVAAGLLSFHLIEQPARRWLNRRWGASDVRRPALA